MKQDRVFIFYELHPLNFPVALVASFFAGLFTGERNLYQLIC